MARPNSVPPVDKIFDDLDSYRDFCRDFGYVFDENDLYANRSYVYRQYLKFTSGKYVRNNWEEGLKPKYYKKRG